MPNYRSKFEGKIGRKMKGCKYEPQESIKNYTLKGTYLPDFVPKDDEDILIEVKGFFRSKQEANKYLAVREDNPGVEIVFIFGDPKTPMPNSRKRRDGTRYSMSEWADKNEIRWYTYDTIPKEWCKKC